MPLSPDLFNALTPPEVWISLGTPERTEAEHLVVCVRIKEAGKRSITASVTVDRYSPTASIVLAVSKAIAAMEIAQQPLTRTLLAEQLATACREWVDPF
jgi:hypothetical protein